MSYAWAGGDPSQYPNMGKDIVINLPPVPEQKDFVDRAIDLIREFGGWLATLNPFLAAVIIIVLAVTFWQLPISNFITEHPITKAIMGKLGVKP